MSDLLKTISALLNKHINEMEQALTLVDAELGSQPVIPAPAPTGITPPAGTPLGNMPANDMMRLMLEGQASVSPGGPPPANVPSDYLFSDFDFNALNGPRVFDNQHDRHAVTPTDDVEILMRVTKHAGNVPDYVAISVADPQGSVARFDRVAVNAEGPVCSFDAKGKVPYTIIVISPENFAVSIRLEARPLG